MPRQVRIEYEGAIYHVMCRGDRREAVFADDRDRETFLATLAEAVSRTGWRVHAYVFDGKSLPSAAGRRLRRTWCAG